MQLEFSRPGTPTDNAFIESFNGRLRQECLDQRWFESLEEARRELELWRVDYNLNRPHTALGLLTPAEARQHPWRNVVTRALSASDPPQVELSPLRLQQGDRLLISSDGLHGVINDERIAAVVGSAESLERICQLLIDEANKAGGPDNITTLMLEIDVP